MLEGGKGGAVSVSDRCDSLQRCSPRDSLRMAVIIFSIITTIIIITSRAWVGVSAPSPAGLCVLSASWFYQVVWGQ